MDLPGLTSNLANQISQQFVPVTGSVFEQRKDSVYLSFQDPSKITLRTKLYLYSSLNTAVPPTPIAELEVTRLSRQYPSARIANTLKFLPIRKGDRVVTAPEKIAVIGLGDEGRIQLISETLANQLTDSGRFIAAASIELGAAWQKQKAALFAQETDTTMISPVNYDTTVAQQLLRQTDYTAIIVGHWEIGDTTNRLSYQVYRYGTEQIQPPVSVMLDNTTALSQLLFAESANPSKVVISSEPKLALDTTVVSPHPKSVPIAQDTTIESSPMQLLSMIALDYQVLGLTAGDINKDNFADLIIFSPTDLKLYKWKQNTIAEFYSKKYGAELPNARTRDWIRHATVVDAWQTVLIYKIGDANSEVYEWKENQLKSITPLDHLALNSLRNPDGRTNVATADLLPESNLYSKESIYLLLIDPSGAIETQSFLLPENFYNIAGGYPVQDSTAIWFTINEKHRVQSFSQTFQLLWTSETTYGNGLAIIPSSDSSDMLIICTSTADYGDTDVLYCLSWNKGKPQPKFTYPVTGSISQLAVADINGDGQPELIIAADKVSYEKIKTTLLIYQLL
ncbi:MAG: FG-GAP repeat domain-containing protein [bacterium]